MRSALFTCWLRSSVSTLPLVWAFAAMTAPAQAADQAGARSTTLQALVVTAERRTVNLQTAPITASVFSGAQLANKNIFSVDTLQFAVPALSVNNFGLAYDFNIRGIGKEDSNIHTPSGIVVYPDGVAPLPGLFPD